MAKKKDDAGDAEGEEKKGGGLGGKLKLVALILPTVLLIAGAVYFFVLAPKSSSASTTAASGTAAASGAEATDPTDEPTPSSTEVAGKLIVVDAVTVNLANGHFLKVGLALQFNAAAGEEASGSKAPDCLISEFSGKTVDELATEEGREAAKKALLKMIRKAYEKQVYEIYYTSFVMN
jgi:flagellar FliL protein